MSSSVKWGSCYLAHRTPKGIHEINHKAPAGLASAKMPVLAMLLPKWETANGTTCLDSTSQECKRPWWMLKEEPPGFQAMGI